MSVVTLSRGFGWPVGPRSGAAGLIGAASLFGVYFAIISLTQGISHAISQLRADGPYVGLLVAGFGVQVALFAELRSADRRHRSSAAVTAVGTGTGMAAMLACCAHHVVDLLPLLGVSAAAVFLDAYKTPLFVVAIAANVVGIAVLGRQLLLARRACALADRPSGT